MPVRNRLKEIRHELQIDTQLEMARLIGVGQSQYNRYERQETQPQLEQALRIAKKLNRKVEDIVYLTEE